MKQLDLFSFGLEDQIIDLRQGEEMEFFRGKERLLIRKHGKFKGVCFYQGPGFSGYALHIDQKGMLGGLDIFVAKIERWLGGRGWNETEPIKGSV
ncbi:hypothetical protein DFO70_11765 [Cytobacillus firmus]|uniref:Uncharacterized protein n=2 Tax=Cytobacillus TaxID=2675230 RepID=A0A366JK81_CYTFI|nr:MULTISPECIES: hypothetical protein [Cytobacillus]RBP87874.1 hypothetical protein DFO70_11765 [Cytobacillus firmus]TDX39237.1 hypothetical protein DFO72_11167 [Cytobacillus oceanisediminis]